MFSMPLALSFDQTQKLVMFNQIGHDIGTFGAHQRTGKMIQASKHHLH
jgi:hypothetical protein